MYAATTHFGELGEGNNLRFAFYLMYEQRCNGIFEI